MMQHPPSQSRGDVHKDVVCQAFPDAVEAGMLLLSNTFLPHVRGRLAGSP